MWRTVSLACRTRASTKVTIGSVLLIGFSGLAPAIADDYSYGRRLFLEKAACSFCHGWAGDGAGHPQSPGRAANLRKSQLSREQIVTVIMCGIPGTSMPHFDDLAYTDNRCYGMTEAELGDRTPNLPPSTTLQKREVEILADFLLARVIGQGSITRQECVEAFGERARSCDEYPAGR